VVEALVAKPHGNGEGASSVVAEDYDGSIGIEFGVGAAGDVAHGHEEGVGKAGELELEGFADVQEERCVGLLAEFGEGFGCDFWV
jgi:hypothetical protein